MDTVQRIDRRQVLLAGGGVIGALAGIGALTERAQAAGYPTPTHSQLAGGPVQGLGGLDRKGIEAAFGLTGSVHESVLQVDFARSDLKASVHGLPVMADFALDSEALFTQIGGTTMMMGELALLESEISPVLDGLAREGIGVTAIHNHLLTTPLVLYVHFMGRGNGARMASGLRRALSPTGTPFGHAEPNADVSKLSFDAKKIEQILGQSGDTSGSVFIVSVPRREKITMDGMVVPSSFGVESLIYFQPLGRGQAAMQAELVVLASEVGAVTQTFRQHNVEVIALHNHELNEQPRLFYMHTFVRGEALTLARAARAALDRTNSATA